MRAPYAPRLMRAIELGHEDARDARAVGHKAANLARFAATFRVPPAFCLATSVYDELEAATDGDATARAALTRLVADAYARLAAAIGTAEPRVAVRSSATGEDSADASFAGPHETILDVHGVDAVVDAVLECWRSAGNERVTAYRKEKGITDPVSVAVLVQQMVPSDVSAIAFGVDPVSGDREVVVIDAAAGLGDRIASGDVTPDRYTVRKSDLGVSGTGVLSEAQATEIAKLTLALERENGHEVDVECAFANGQLYLLQCRPITTLGQDFPLVWEDPEDAKYHWVRDDAHSGAPHPHLLNDYFLEAPTAGMRRRAEIDDAPLFARTQPFLGRTYVSIRRRIFEGDLAELDRAMVAKACAAARTFRRTWDDEYVPRLREHWDWIARATHDSATVPLGELAARWDALWPRVNDIWTMHMMTTSRAYSVMDELATTYERLTGRPRAEALKLTQARAPSLHRLARDLHALTAAYASGDRAAYERAQSAFLAEHGNLGSAGEDMRDLPWAEDHALLERELARRAADPQEDPDARRARLIAEGDEVERRARELLRDRPDDLARFDEVLAAARATGPLTEEHNYVIDRQVMSIVARFFRAVGARMAREGLLTDAADVHHFHIREVSEALRTRRDLRDLTRERAAEYAGWLRLRYPKTLGAPAPADAAPVPSALNYRVRQDATGVIKGAPASSGVRRGHACLVRGIDDFAKMRKGDILVCRSSNVSWIPLFTIAAAVVTDVGGPLSHAAVVAREFGVPAVVGCDVALETLRDGDLVEVDGDAGTVRKIER